MSDIPNFHLGGSCCPGCRPLHEVWRREELERQMKRIEEVLKTMPHYADGTLATVGDLVKGKPYNTKHEVVGEVIQITEGTESCNLVVAFVEAPISPISTSDLVELTRAGIPLPHFSRVKGGRVIQGCSHDSEAVHLIPRYDYGETKAFVKV